MLLNYNDYAFVKIVIDDKSLPFLMERMSVIPGLVNKKVFIRSLFEMVKDGRMTSVQYMDFIELNQHNSHPEEVLASLFLDVSQAIGTYSPLEAQDTLYQRAFRLARHALEKCASEEEDKVTILMGHLISFAKHSRDLNTLLTWLDKGDARLSYYNRWAIVKMVF